MPSLPFPCAAAGFPRRGSRRAKLAVGSAGLALLALVAGIPAAAAGRALTVFAGTASKPAAEEATARFEAATGTRVDLHFGGSGAVLSQMALARRGDVYLPGSSDFMEIARQRGLVDPATVVPLAYLLPAIAVPKGNPRGIRHLEDLAAPGLRVGIARPQTVCVGLYAVEVLQAAGLAEAVQRNIVTQTESCTRTAQVLSLGLVDAVLGWDVFDDWSPEHIDTVSLPPERVVRIGTIPAAVATFTDQPARARAYLTFLAGPEGREIFRRHGYRVELAEVRALAGPGARVGGAFALPEGWR